MKLSKIQLIDIQLYIAEKYGICEVITIDDPEAQPKFTALSYTMDCKYEDGLPIFAYDMIDGCAHVIVYESAIFEDAIKETS